MRIYNILRIDSLDELDELLAAAYFDLDEHKKTPAPGGDTRPLIEKAVEMWVQLRDVVTITIAERTKSRVPSCHLERIWPKVYDLLCEYINAGWFDVEWFEPGQPQVIANCAWGLAYLRVLNWVSAAAILNELTVEYTEGFLKEKRFIRYASATWLKRNPHEAQLRLL